MPTKAKGRKRRAGPPLPRARKSARGRRVHREGDTGKADILQLVRAGVEKFIMSEATVADFFKTIRDATTKEKSYSHQLTKAVFAKIVREAIKKRALTKVSRNSTNSHLKNTHAKDSNRSR